MSKKALGRTLDSIIKGASLRPAAGGEAVVQVADPDPQPGERVLQVSLSEVVASPMQPRKTFREDQLTELMDSIREHGVLQPLIVRKAGGKLELIAGERRFRASQKLGVETVPVIVREASDRTVLELALIENIQRADLNPVEEAEAYSRLAKEFGMKQEDIAQRVGRNRATVANAMRLLDLSPDVKLMLSQMLITTGHAKALLGIRDNQLQSALAQRVVRESLTVRQTEQCVQKENDDSPRPSPGSGSTKSPSSNSQPQGNRSAAAAMTSLQNKLREHLATQVNIIHGDKKGRIEIEYYGNDDLGRILDLLGVQAE